MIAFESLFMTFQASETILASSRFFYIFPVGNVFLKFIFWIDWASSQVGVVECSRAMQEMFLEDPQRATDALVLGLGHHQLRQARRGPSRPRSWFEGSSIGDR